MDIDLGILFVSIIGLSALSPAASVSPMLPSTGFGTTAATALTSTASVSRMPAVCTEPTLV